MKSEKLNNVILFFSAIVFILQTIGYFSPAWFIKEIVVKPTKYGMAADGRMFKLPYWNEMFDRIGLIGSDTLDEGNWDRMESIAGANGEIPHKDSMDNEVHNNPVKRSATVPPRPTRKPLATKPAQSGGESFTPCRQTPGKPGQPAVGNIPCPTGQPHEKPGRPATGGSIAGRPVGKPWKPAIASISSDQPVESIGGLITIENSNELKDEKPDRPLASRPIKIKPTVILNHGSTTTSYFKHHKDTTDQPSRVKTTSNPTKPVKHFAPNFDESDLSTKVPKKPSRPQVDEAGSGPASTVEFMSGTRRHILYLSAGLWFGRACIYPAANWSDIYPVDDTSVWCALYIRIDNLTLEKRKNMFEFRIEATVALVASALSLVLASTGCCSHRRHGARAILSLSLMFISGAVMAVPVVHMIMEHIEIHGHVMTRRRKNLMVHDLFEHYSVIICAAASLLSTLTTIVMVIVKCRSNSTPSNWYDVTHDDTHDDKRKPDTVHELPDSWVHNSKINTKIALPTATILVDDVRGETESGYCEMRDDDMSGTNTEDTSVTSSSGPVNEFGQLELIPSELKTFEM